MIQHDYGGFLPRFPGIVINIPDRDCWQIFIKQFDTELQNERNKIHDQDLIFRNYSLATVYTHELKHFTDSLISPFSNKLFRLSLNRGFNAKELYSYLTTKTRVLGLPLQNWVLNIKNSHSAIRTFNNSSQSINTGVSDLFSEEEILISENIKKYNSDIKTLTQNKNNGIKPLHVFEATAILSQYQDIYHALGEKEALFFYEFLSKTNNKYTKGLDQLLAIQFVDQYYSLNLITNWCLLGNSHLDKEKACPSYRFQAILEFLKKNNQIDKSISILTHFDNWNSQFGFASTRDSLNKVIKDNNKVMEYFFNNKGYRPYDRELILKIAKKKMSLTEDMINKFLSKPEIFIFPHEYANEFANFQIPLQINFSTPIEVNKYYIEQIFKPVLYDNCGNDCLKIRRILLRQTNTKKILFSEDEANELGDFLEVGEFFITDERDSVDNDFFVEIGKRSDLKFVKLDVLTAFED